MSTPKKYILETSESRFEISISESESGNGLFAEYYGTSPKSAKIMSPGDDLPMIREIGSGTTEGRDIDTLLESCREEITKIDGDIISEYEG